MILLYLRYLGRNKLFSFVSIFGFSLSLMFVVILGVYVKNELSYDDFQQNADRVYLYSDGQCILSNCTNAPYLKANSPDIEDYCRVTTLRKDLQTEATNTSPGSSLLVADANFFSIFSFPLVRGNAGDVLSQPNSIVLTESLARKLFGAKNPLGAVVRISGDQATATVQGVMKDFPEQTQFLSYDAVVSLDLARIDYGEDFLTNRGAPYFSCYYVAKKGRDLQKAESSLTQVLDRLGMRYFNESGPYKPVVGMIPLRQVHFEVKDNQMGMFPVKTNDHKKVMIFFAIALVILIVAILNYINMCLAQVGGRGKQAALMRLFGSSRFGLVRRFVGESVVMLFVSTLLSIGLAFLFESFFDNTLTTKLDIANAFDLWTILSCLLAILLLGVLSGIAPALVLARFRPIEVVRGTFRRYVRGTYTKVLVVAQYVVCIVLLICSMVMIKQTYYLNSYDLGYDPSHLASMRLMVPANIRESVREQLMRVPGVDRVAFSHNAPWACYEARGFGRQSDAKDVMHWYRVMAGDSTFFVTIGIPLRTGGFGMPTEQSVYASYAAIKEFGDMREQTIDLGAKDVEQHIPVSGLFPDFRTASLKEKGQMPIIVFCGETEELAWDMLSVRFAHGADSRHILDAMQAILERYSPGAQARPTLVQDQVRHWYQAEERTAKLLSAFALLTLVIMVLGVSAMSVYMVRQREKEIAVRRVNGASTHSILRLLSGESLLRIVVSFVLACPIAYWAMNKWLGGFEYRTPLSWWLFPLAGAIVFALAQAVILMFSYRAAGTNPIRYLKNE